MSKVVRSWRRSDWKVGRVHLIRRSYLKEREFGVMFWGYQAINPVPTLDVWVGRTMWTLRWVK